MTKDSFDAKRWARWLGTFIGFPLAGVAARLVAGNIDDPGSAALGGLVGGAVLGTVQSVVSGLDRADWPRWIGATAGGLAVGLTAGAGAVGYATDTTSLVTMGAVSGAAVGLAQAFSIRLDRTDRIGWALATPVLWAGAWWITLHVIVDAERQHAVFGSSGALVASALAGVLVAVRSSASPAVAGGRRTQGTGTGTGTGTAVAR